MRSIFQGYRVRDAMIRQFHTLHENEPLDRVLDKMNARGCPTLLVQQQDELVGILSEEHLGQWRMLHSSVRQRSSEVPTQTA